MYGHPENAYLYFCELQLFSKKQTGIPGNMLSLQDISNDILAKVLARKGLVNSI